MKEAGGVEGWADRLRQGGGQRIPDRGWTEGMGLRYLDFMLKASKFCEDHGGFLRQPLALPTTATAATPRPAARGAREDGRLQAVFLIHKHQGETDEHQA